jgi:CheY-like chemotaxis protein
VKGIVDDTDERAALLAAILRSWGKQVTFVLLATPRGVVTIEAREAKA